MKHLIGFLILMVLYSCKDGTPQNLESETKQPIVDELPNPSKEQSSLPRLFEGGTHLYLSWVSTLDSQNYLQLDRFDGAKWLHTDTLLTGTDWFVNWADFPQFAENNEYLLSSYLKKSDSGTYTYDIRLNHYSPKSSEWKKDLVLHTDGTKSEHGFVSMQPYGENGFFVSWLDGRNTAGEHDHMHSGTGAMTLRGAFIDSDGQVFNEMELDPRVCDCCNTASTITPNAVVVAYRDRTEGEIRDIAIVRHNGATWEASKTLWNDQWMIPGCPVNGPALDSFDKAVAVAWFTAAKEDPKVQVAFSEDEGETFGIPFRMDAGNAIGRVDIVMLGETGAAVSWMEPDGGEAVIKVRKIATDGTMGFPITISKSTIERTSGFPQMERFNNRLYFAWTQNENGRSQIKMASVSLEAL